MARFKILRGQMMAISPENEVEFRPVNVIFDSTNDMFGIQLIGESQLKGYSFFVSQLALRKARDAGNPSDSIEKPR